MFSKWWVNIIVEILFIQLSDDVEISIYLFFTLMTGFVLQGHIEGDLIGHKMQCASYFYWFI